MRQRLQRQKPALFARTGTPGMWFRRRQGIYQHGGGPLEFETQCGYHARIPSAASADPVAALAQLVEHIIRNDGVRCSSHLSGTKHFKHLA
jgi:hypothetical protein